MLKHFLHNFRPSLSILFCVALAACGGGSDGGSGGTSGSSSSSSYALGGTVAGLSIGDSINLSDGGETLAVSANGRFQFKSPVPNGTVVKVAAQPSSGTLCSVSDVTRPTSNTGAFISGAANATAVQINCGTFPAFKPSLPQVNSTAAVSTTVPVVIKNARVVPVYFSDTPNQATHTDFLQKLTTSSFWSVLNQYGVGSATVAAPAKIANPAPSQLARADIVSLLTANASSWIANVDSSAFFVFYVPAGTTNEVVSCGGGYHSSAYINGQSVAFALVSGCGNPERTAQHEIMEGVADPFGLGYRTIGTDEYIWTNLVGNYQGVEIGDMCELENATVSDLPGYTLQPIWSNAAAVAGKNPCFSATSDNTYFGAIPTLPTMLQSSGGHLDHGVVVPPGGSVTIPVRLFSNTPMTGPMSVAVKATGFVAGPTRLDGLQFKFDKDYGSNGETLMLTITAPLTAFPGMITLGFTASYGSDQYSFPAGVANSMTY
jgi:hypothetical protein